MTNKKLYNECACHGDDHELKWHYDSDEGWDDHVYLHYYLTKDPLYRRIWNAIKYIFNSDVKGGHFGETLLDDKEVANLVDFLIEFQNRKDPDFSWEDMHIIMPRLQEGILDETKTEI